MKPQSVSGSSSPLGASITSTGVNFSLFSRTATAVELVLFDKTNPGEPASVLALDPVKNRSYHYWHTFVPGLRSGQIYGYRVHGPDDEDRGLHFDREKILLDPYGRGVLIPTDYTPVKARRPGSNAAIAMKSVVVDTSDYDWEGDIPLQTPSSRTTIYEAHVRGFTCHPSSGVQDGKRGTYAGFIEKIPYLKDLGVTAVELLPIFAFDPLACPIGRVNYWGYQPVSFFAPHPLYSSDRSPLGAVVEFKDLVKALHRAGIEVILDVVFNHTAEGGHDGTTLSFRGIDNPTYYILSEGGRNYADYSGCGNSLNADNTIVRRLILDSLRYWVEEFHVDGFRFDLASVLTRNSFGQPIPNPPVIWDIESDPALAGTKLIAEAWDATGLYQVGTFVGDAWKEWNGRFRDDARDFFRGEPGIVARMADRMLGSHEVFGHESREAEQSVNFVTCHDGFTLNDLVTYNQKHNEANGENNRDGTNDNRSWNCGLEGPTDDPEIEALRNRQVKNFYSITLLSLGTPMILMGDEIRRTQGGNNNAYCHDNESNWLDWSLLHRHADVHRFVKLFLNRRRMRDTRHEEQRVSLTDRIEQATKSWHGTKLNRPDWGPHSRSIAFYSEAPQQNLSIYLILNAFWEPLEFELPPHKDSPWRRWIDTALPSPEDIVAWEDAPLVDEESYRAAPWSVVLLHRQLRRP